MALRINSNIVSQEAQRNLNVTKASLSSSLSRLSSSLRINSQDNAPSQSVADRLRAQTAGLSQAQNNDNQAMAELKIRDAELGEVSSLLVRMHQLRTQSDSENWNAQDSEALEKEFAEQSSEINRIADVYNQTGSRPDYTAALGTRDGSLQSTEDIRKAMDTVSAMRSDLGAQQNALNDSISNRQSSVDTLSTSRPQLDNARDASETAEQIRSRMREQLDAAMRSQANAMPQQVLALLRA